MTYNNLKLLALVGSVVALALTAAFVIAAPKHSKQEAQAGSQTRQPLSTKKNSAGKTLVSADRILGMLHSDIPGIEATLDQAKQQWDISYVPMMLEVARFLPRREKAVVLRTLEIQTGQRWGGDFDKWMQWNWKQKYEPHPDYAKFKSDLYSKIDPRFSEYFVKTDNATIRLDEVRWGGVRRDGIPPLKNPKMLTARQATYLADTDVVFGIKLNGDARCYPKRILAWHEMFKDTIGGQSVAGVY